MHYCIYSTLQCLHISRALHSCLWFFLEPLVHKSDNYDFLRKLVETIKQTEDAQEPTNTEANKVVRTTKTAGHWPFSDQIAKLATQNLGLNCVDGQPN